ELNLDYVDPNHECYHYTTEPRNLNFLAQRSIPVTIRIHVLPNANSTIELMDLAFLIILSCCNGQHN
ncbi:hypothetical protein LCGC14_2140170, partial [marine sediment metagenome]